MENMPDPIYQCAVCKTAIIILDNQIIRACEHSDAPILATLTATLRGEGDVQ